MLPNDAAHELAIFGTYNASFKHANKLMPSIYGFIFFKYHFYREAPFFSPSKQKRLLLVLNNF
jgi:hypothetical protein